MQVLSISVGYLPHLFGLKKIQVVVTSIPNATHLGACKMYVPIPCNVSTDWHRGRQIQDLLNGTATMWLNHYT